MTFTEDIRRFRVKTGIALDLIVRKLALDGLGGVIRRSPVDTGRFRASWRLGIGKINFSVEAPRTHNSGTEFGDGPTGEELSSSGADDALSAKAGGVVYITNSLPYAQRLEAGYSQQAPPDGIVGATVQELSDSFGKIVEQVR